MSWNIPYCSSYNIRVLYVRQLWLRYTYSVC